MLERHLKPSGDAHFLIGNEMIAKEKGSFVDLQRCYYEFGPKSVR